MSHSFKAPENSAVTVEQLAKELVEASRVIENLASRAAEQLEASFFTYAKSLRKRAEAHLQASEPSSESARKDDYDI